MQYSDFERELSGSPLKNAPNGMHYMSSAQESPVRSLHSSSSKTRNLVKSSSKKSTGKGSQFGDNYSPSPVKKQAENRERDGLS